MFSQFRKTVGALLLLTMTLVYSDEVKVWSPKVLEPVAVRLFKKEQVLKIFLT